jgi:hypothetical protein
VDESEPDWGTAICEEAPETAREENVPRLLDAVSPGGQDMQHLLPRPLCRLPQVSVSYLQIPSPLTNSNFPRAKKKAYPDGYPGDEPSSTSTAPIKYSCHKCHQHYPPVPHPKSPEGLALGDTIEPLDCTRCGHSRCASCRRARPRKVKGERTPDPSLVQNLEAKLAALQL